MCANRIKNPFFAAFCKVGVFAGIGKTGDILPRGIQNIKNGGFIMNIKNRCAVRRALSVMLALLMLLTAAPLTAFAGETKTFITGEVVKFGSYPTSEVTDETLKTALAEAAGSTDYWTSYKYYVNYVQSDIMKFTDVEYAGAKYRGVYFTQYRPYYANNYQAEARYSWQDENGYNTNTAYWFRFEPIEWQVLSFDGANDAVAVMSKYILDAQQYYHNPYSNRTIGEETVSPNNYEYSDIRAWLNDAFYNTAFGETEKSAVIAATLDNSGSGSSYGSNPTTDNVWLLSYAEAKNTSYGFTADTKSTAARQATGTAYARCQGLSVNSSTGYSYWYLRSASSSWSSACDVESSGAIDFNNVGSTSGGIRPVITLDAQSDKIDSCAHTLQDAVTQPTCTDEGFTTHTCTECGASYKDAFTDSLGHDYSVFVETVKAATCTENGEEKYKCSRCGDETEKETPADGDAHNWGEWTVIPAACTADGSKTRVCLYNAQHTETETIPAVGHTPAAQVEENRIEPSDSEDGGYDEVIYCSVCGEELSREHKTVENDGIIAKIIKFLKKIIFAIASLFGGSYGG